MEVSKTLLNMQNTSAKKNTKNKLKVFSGYIF